MMRHLLCLPCIPMQKVKRRSSISTSVDIRTVSARCRLVWKTRETGVVVVRDGSLADEDGRVSSSSTVVVVVDADRDGLGNSCVTWAGDVSGSSLDVENVIVSS